MPSINPTLTVVGLGERAVGLMAKRRVAGVEAVIRISLYRFTRVLLSSLKSLVYFWLLFARVLIKSAGLSYCHAPSFITQYGRNRGGQTKSQLK
jgi:hypothetical protein